MEAGLLISILLVVWRCVGIRRVIVIFLTLGVEFGLLLNIVFRTLEMQFHPVKHFVRFFRRFAIFFLVVLVLLLVISSVVVVARR